MDTTIVLDWFSDRVYPNKPATREQISRCEKFVGFKFPSDFLEFYLLYNGFEDYVMDSKFLSLWSIDRIQKEFDSTDDFIAFSDYLINSHIIGYIKGEEGIYKDYDRTTICNSFTEFLDHWKDSTLEYI